MTLRVQSLASDASDEVVPFNLPVANLEGQTGINLRLIQIAGTSTTVRSLKF